jgi:hypothetical protein
LSESLKSTLNGGDCELPAAGDVIEVVGAVLSILNDLLAVLEVFPALSALYPSIVQTFVPFAGQ